VGDSHVVLTKNGLSQDHPSTRSLQWDMEAGEQWNDCERDAPRSLSGMWPTEAADPTAHSSAMANLIIESSVVIKLFTIVRSRGTMLKTIEGIYRDGKIELLEAPGAILDETRVLITFLLSPQPSPVHLSSRGIDEAQAAELRRPTAHLRRGLGAP